MPLNRVFARFSDHLMIGTRSNVCEFVYLIPVAVEEFLVTLKLKSYVIFDFPANAGHAFLFQMKCL